jgi:hypothetical protein
VNSKALSSNISIDKNDVGLGNVPNTDATVAANITQDSTHRFATDTEKTTWNGKQDALGYTAENSANKSTTTSLGSSNTLYPTQNAVKIYVDTVAAGKQDALGYTAENSANRRTSFQVTPDDSHYASESWSKIHSTRSRTR